MELVSCPFDPVHTIERRRLQAHIIKCKRNLPPNHDFVECKYYHLHYVRRGQMEEHYATCEHRISKEAQQRMWEAEFASVAATPAFQENIPDWHFSDESWDVNATSFKYDQQKQRANHMTVPEGLSKAKRKEFREKERDRLRELEDKNPKSSVRKEPSFVINQADKDFGPVPRLPETQTARGACRIAAKFPGELHPITEQDGDAFRNSYAAHVIKGPGRTIQDGTVVNSVSYQYVVEQFPELN